MTGTEIREFKKYVRDTLVKTYHMSESEAESAVRNSYLSQELTDDSDFVEHDTVEEWAEFIREELNNKVLLMM